MKLIYLVLPALILGCSGQDEKSVQKLDEEEKNVLYAIGVEISQQLKVLDLNQAELAAVKEGFSDNVLQEELAIDMSVYRGKIQDWGSKRIEAAAARHSQQGEEYVKKLLEDPSIAKTVSGALVEVTKDGTGEQPTGSSKVTIHYHGTLIDGTVFDSSKDRGEPATFALGGLIKCWGEGIPIIKVGGSARLVCPPDTAYGATGSPPVIPPNATLIFDVELIEIVKE